MTENVKILTNEQSWNQPFLQILSHLHLVFKKTETTLHSYFFVRKPNLQSKFENSFKKFLTFLYPWRPLTAHKNSSKHCKFFFQIQFFVFHQNLHSSDPICQNSDFSGRSTLGTHKKIIKKFQNKFFRLRILGFIRITSLDIICKKWFLLEHYCPCKTGFCLWRNKFCRGL